MTDLTDPLVQRFRRARRDDRLTVLDGFYALTHALRFGARPVEIATCDLTGLHEVAALRAPDLLDLLAALDPIVEVDPETLSLLSTQGPRGIVMAIVPRPPVDVPAALSDPRPSDLVFLEEPRNLGNIGACVRVAAAAGAAGVLTTGHNDPYHPDAVRGAAALQYALPVARVPSLPECDRPLVAVEAGGRPLHDQEIPPRAILAFGGERHGLSEDLLTRADLTVGIPMTPGILSLNLATTVATVLFHRRPSDQTGP